MCFSCCFSNSTGELYQAGLDARHQGNYRAAAEYFKEGAERGNPKCQVALGHLYAGGFPGIPVNFDEARKWHRKALYTSEGAHASAALEIINKKAKEAMQYNTFNSASSSANQSPDLESQYRSGKRCMDSKKFREAEQYFKYAAQNGHAQAQYELGKLYATGQPGVNANEAEACKWLKQALDNGIGPAQNFLNVLNAQAGQTIVIDY